MTEMIEPMPALSIKSSSPATWWSGPVLRVWNCSDREACCPG